MKCWVALCEAGSGSFSAKRGLRIHVIFPHVNGEKTCYTHLDLCKSSHAVPMQYELVKILRAPPWKRERGSRFHTANFLQLLLRFSSFCI